MNYIHMKTLVFLINSFHGADDILTSLVAELSWLYMYCQLHSTMSDAFVTLDCSFFCV